MCVGNKSQRLRRPWTEEVSFPTLSIELCRAWYLKAVMFSPCMTVVEGKPLSLFTLRKIQFTFS